MSLDYQHIKSIMSTWPALSAALAFITLVVGALAANGYIDPAMHKSDATIINRHITEIEESLNDNKNEHRNMQTDIRSIMSALGRIEGRLTGR
jgi:hypothetical protein